LSDIDPTQSPLYNYNQTRLKVLEKQVPKDMMVAEGDDTDSEEDVPKPQAATKQKQKKHDMEVDGDDDVVEDFELSDDEL
jgi:hypothetical protein